MDWFNPVEWFAWLYGKVFQNHFYIGAAVVMVVFAVLGLVLWIRGVDHYKEAHPTPSEASTPAPKQQAATTNSFAPQSVAVVQSSSSDGVQNAGAAHVSKAKSQPDPAKKHPSSQRDTFDITGGSVKHAKAAVWADGPVDINIKGGNYTKNDTVVDSHGKNTKIKMEDVTANENKTVIRSVQENDVKPASVPPPPITLQNSPGSAVSVNLAGRNNGGDNKCYTAIPSALLRAKACHQVGDPRQDMQDYDAWGSIKCRGRSGIRNRIAGCI